MVNPQREMIIERKVQIVEMSKVSTDEDGNELDAPVWQVTAEMFTQRVYDNGDVVTQHTGDDGRPLGVEKLTHLDDEDHGGYGIEGEESMES
jgi:hypothetical protein